MLSDFKRGEILYDKNWVYGNRKDNCDKLLLVLNKNYAPLDDLIVVPATTIKKETSNLIHGCNEEKKHFYFEQQIGFYKPKTVIQFDFIGSIDFETIENRIRREEVKRENWITTQQEFGLIINCLKKIKYDIDNDIQKMIF